MGTVHYTRHSIDGIPSDILFNGDSRTLSPCMEDYSRRPIKSGDLRIFTPKETYEIAKLRYKSDQYSGRVA
jgi:hypothetical protein